jgi:hypoxanthine-DNA glycosylase
MINSKRSFAPLADHRVRVLVLGSLPGEQSLALSQYYANPRNQFWRLIGEVVEQDLVSLAYDSRLEALLSCGVGLWDVVESASRRGSLDAAIRDHRPNDLAALVQTLPELRAVAFNGGTAARIGQKQLAAAAVARAALPSSSPAYTLPFAEKLVAWLKLRRYL